MDNLTVTAWKPPADSGKKIDVNEATIQRFELKIDKPHNRVERLRNTVFGKFYVKYLKKNVFIRWLVLWVWRNGYPIYANARAYLLGGETRKWRELTSHKKYILQHQITAKVLASQEVVETPAPGVFPSADQNYLESPHLLYTYPDLYVFVLSEAVVCGGTNFVLVDEEVLHHDLYDFPRDYTSEELHGRVTFNRALSKARWLSHDLATEVIPTAASFLDSCASNYAHWMTEVLPRVAVFCANEAYKDIPILINDGLHRNLMESLRVVSGRSRKIIMLPTGKSVKVAQLYVSSVAGYVPFERRNTKLSKHSHGVFSPFALSLIISRANAYAARFDAGWPDKIILRRKTGARKVSNFAGLESALVPKGFKVVETEGLTFIEQVILFSRAKIIIGSSGAALANVMFAPKDAKIFILISKFPNTSYWYWQNIACASGKKINYVLGSVGHSGRGIHADFTIDLEGFLSALEVEVLT